MKQDNKDFYLAVLSIFSVVTIFLIILLVVQNNKLRNQIINSRSMLPTLQEGDILLPFESRNMNDKWIQISYGKNYKKKIFFVFSNSCSICSKVIPLWKELNSKIDKEKYEVLGILIDGNKLSPNVSRAINGNFEVITFPNIKVQLDYKIFYSPITFFVDSMGTVEKIWLGEFEEHQIAEALKLM